MRAIRRDRTVQDEVEWLRRDNRRLRRIVRELARRAERSEERLIRLEQNDD